MKKKSGNMLLVAGLFFGWLATSHAEATPRIEVTLCKQVAGHNPVEPTTQFVKDSPIVYVTWKSADLKEGQTIKAAWIAEDVGTAAAPNTLIAEKPIKVTNGSPIQGTIWWSGKFSLSKPTAGWPVGKYRVEISVDDKPVKMLQFTVQ